MAFTKVLPSGISSSFNLTVDSINSVGVVTATSIVANTGTFSGNVSVAGTITYEDVTNIDSVGIITARSIIDAQGNVTVGAGLSVVGVSTFQNGIYVTSGNVGIGTTNPGSKLVVEDNAPSGTSNVYINNTGGDAVLYMLNNDRYSAGLGTLADNGSYIEFSGKWNSTNTAANRTFGRIGAFKENNTSANGAGYLALYSRPDGGSLSERLRITSAGDVNVAAGGSVFIANGNLVFSTSGTGIDFSATSDGTGMVSETLSDYEEGEWTPEIVGSTGGTATASTGAGSGGWYVRVGNTVWLTFYFANPTITGTMSGSLRLNLPFTQSDNDRFDNGAGGPITYTRNFSSGGSDRRITLNINRGASFARFKTLYDNATSETADLTQTMASLTTTTLISGNMIMRVD